MEKPLIDLDNVVGWEDTALLVLADTGIEYTAQCGGISCTHPKAEGYVLGIGNFAQDFNDCSYGCSYIGDDPKIRQLLASDFDDYCISKCLDWRWKINFDWNRIDLLQEGWIPVVLNGSYEEDGSLVFKNTQGFIHNGNCD